ncbi:MAG: FAD-dependent oxidoreductase [Bacilli bacterium]|nr:FAD-dependent oxidoreductase [Bacilli bacterium]
MKIIVIGCTHAGTAAVLNIKKLHPNAEVTVYEKNNNISFLSCGIALYVCGVVKDQNGLFYCSPNELMELGVKTQMLHEVNKIDFDQKQVHVTNLETNETITDGYDKLVIATGSWPMIPPIEGIYSDNVLLSKNFTHSNQIIAMAKDVKKITVVGAGYIGVELAEAFEIQGKEVTLIDAEPRIMYKYLDKEYTDIAEKAFSDHGVKLAIGEKVQAFERNELGKVTKVKTNKGEYETELVIMCIGFKPNTGLVAHGVETNKFGAIIVDEYMQTSRKDVFACGDCATIFYNPTKETRYIPLATNAVRMGTLVARNIVEPTLKHIGTQGTSGIKIYEWSISSTGVTEMVAIEKNINYGTVTVRDNNRPEFMPTYDEAMLKIVFDKDTRAILGGQILSHMDLTQTMNTLSVCIQKEMTVEELTFVDFFFQPNFNKPWNLLNLAGLSALDIK